MNKNKSDSQTGSFVSKLLSNKCKLASVLTVLFVFSVATAYAAPKHNFVRITDGDYEVSGYSDLETVKDLIDEHGLEISKYDVVYPSPDTKLSSGMTVTIDRPKRVNLTCDGATVSYWTVADDFGEFVRMHDIDISESDISDINLKEELDFENNVSITRVETETVETSSEIPFETKYIDDNSLEKGKTVVRTPGKAGTMITQYKVVTHDGVEMSRETVAQWVDAEPVDKVVARGTKTSSVNTYSSQTAVAASAPAQISSGTISVNGQIYSYSKVLTCSATAYDLSFQSTGKRPGDPGYGITASGTYAKPGTVAVDPRVIPLGTKMYIVSTDGSVVYGLCTAEDTGGAIKGNKVDLFYNTTAECMQFGRRNVTVYILR